MPFLSKVAKFLAGDGVGVKIVDTVAKRFPPNLSDKEKADIQQTILTATHEQHVELLQLAQQDEQAFNDRIRDMEGTAKDLQQFGIIGKIIIFLRGLQRPLWGFGVLYLDFMVFSGQWTILDDSASDTTKVFWIINFLVLGFLFGERAMKNVMPLINKSKGGS